jgi:hypothetical protein
VVWCGECAAQRTCTFGKGYGNTQSSSWECGWYTIAVAMRLCEEADKKWPSLAARHPKVSVGNVWREVRLKMFQYAQECSAAGEDLSLPAARRSPRRSPYPARKKSLQRRSPDAGGAGEGGFMLSGSKTGDKSGRKKDRVPTTWAGRGRPATDRFEQVGFPKRRRSTRTQ